MITSGLVRIIGDKSANIQIAKHGQDHLEELQLIIGKEDELVLDVFMR